jgi:rare lipoprotein A
MRLFLGFLLCFLLASCAPVTTVKRPSYPAGYETFDGLASYYADKFHGRQTANGEIYDKDALTAAHKKLPFGTKLRVTNLKNNKSVIVKVNDRGPFVKGRVVDLSRRAAEKLDMIDDGVVKVRVEILS